MFIELHDYEDNYPILVNTQQITFVTTEDKITQVEVVNTSWSVKESYEQVKSLLDVSSIG